MFGKMSAYFRNGRGQRGASTGSDAKNKDESLKQPLNGKLDSKVSRHNYSIGDPRNKMGDLAEEDNFAGEVCLITESPFRILKLAGKGNVKEFESFYERDPSKLFVKDAKGRGVLHIAAENGFTALLDWIIDHGVDIDEKDNDLNTPLHVACAAGNKDGVEFLLSHNADSTLQNKCKATPLHVVVEKDHPQLIQIFSTFPSADVNIEGKNGSTPLHYCAYMDRAECAKELLQYGAKPCKACKIGLFPIHIAAQNSASKTLKVFVESAQSQGYTLKQVMEFVNQERNTALHSAVNGGDIEIVEVCLRAGAPIDATTDDQSSVVHLAAANGHLDILKLLFEKQPEKKAMCIRAKDCQGRTPLHRAAIFDRSEVVTYLLAEGAKPDEMDKASLTPWLLAASKRAWNVVQIFLKQGIDLTIHDPKNRNILHVIIMNGGKPDQFNICMCQKKFSQLLNEADDFGSTPLHYACQEGMLGTIESMLKLGAVLNTKNKEKQSPLYFAASCGRYNTCKHLLDTCSGPTTINDTDGEGRTALHGAAMNGHTRVVTLLLQHGATPFRDLYGNSPVHLAAKSGYTKTLGILLEVHSHLMDVSNKQGNTPIHLAAEQGHSNVATMLLSMGAKMTKNEDLEYFLDLAIKHEHKDVCVATVSHERWTEAMDRCSALYGCPMSGFVKFMPSVCQMVLDRCRTMSDDDKNSKTFHNLYNFKYLQMSQEKIRDLKKQGVNAQPLLTLNLMVKYNRVECLSHPVCINFLRMKWQRIGLWFHLINLVFYLIFLGALTAFIVTSPYKRLPVHGTNVSGTTAMPSVISGDPVINGTTGNDSWTNMSMDSNALNEDPHSINRKDPKQYYEEVKLKPSQQIVVTIILVFCVINVMKEIGQMYQQKWYYFVDITNLWEWILYITSTIFIAPFTVGHNSAMQWQCAAIAVFLAWFNLLIFLQRFDFFGIYVVMFLEILKTLVQVLTVFSILIVAFGLTFYVLFNSVDEAVGHEKVWLSLVTTTVMMTGSIEYLDNWITPYSNQDMIFQTLTFIMLVVFILLIPILLVNLLIGLAVGDIEAIQRDARLKRIAMQVVFNSDLESKLPYRLLKLADKQIYKVYPNCSHHALSSAWNKVTKSRGVAYDPENENLDMNSDQVFQMEHQSFMYDELNKQKNRLKQISTDLSKQTDLLRLIIQKMEIHTEASDWDDDTTVTNPSAKSPALRAMGWSSATLRHNLLKQSHVIAKWKSHDPN